MDSAAKRPRGLTHHGTALAFRGFGAKTKVSSLLLFISHLSNFHVAAMGPEFLSSMGSLLGAVHGAEAEYLADNNGSLSVMVDLNATVPPWDWLLVENATAANATVANATGTDDGVPRVRAAKRVVALLSYVVGIGGNAAALYILWSRQRVRRPRSSSKHALMLCCLACNDLVALLGMFVLMSIDAAVPANNLNTYWYCVARVVWRLFGLGSGCVAAVMALERWLALTHPFLYQKHVTVQVILCAIFVLWGTVLVLVCLPFTGFGLYIKGKKCQRYRDATEPIDVAYAYLFFTFGALLCLCIVWCNLAVVRALCHMELGKWNSACSRRISRQSLSTSSTKQLCRKSTLSKIEMANTQVQKGDVSTVYVHVPVRPCESDPLNEQQQSSRRLLKTSFRSKERDSIECNCAACSPSSKLMSDSRSNGKNEQLCYNVCTTEEVAFARLMTVLSIFFVVCWAPQMISILLAQFAGTTRGSVFFTLSDLLMSLHFTIDPYVYVVLRNYQQKRKKKPCMPFLKLMCRQCSNQSQTTNEIELTERCVSHEEIS